LQTAVIKKRDYHQRKSL